MDTISHVMLESIEQAQAFELDMVTLPFHISHTLQPLDVFCFKTFKTKFKEWNGARWLKGITKN